MPGYDREVPFSYLLMAVLFVIIAVLVIGGIWSSYENSRSTLVSNAERLQGFTESQINTSFRMIDTSLKLYDRTFNRQMEDAFGTVMAEYQRAGGDPARMDLDALKQRTGGMDVFVINDSCVVQYTSKPKDLNLDFRVIYPDIVGYFNTIRNSSGFFPDRVVKDWTTGRMTKYGYMPTPDHRFVMELGLESELFEVERRQLDYYDVVDELRAFNPYLDEVLLFQKQKRLIHNASYVPTPEEDAMLDLLLWTNRSRQVATDPAAGRTVVWLPVDMRDQDYSSDMSIFAKLTYNDTRLAGEVERLGLVHGFAALLVLFSGGLLAVMVSRRLSRPIEQIAADIDAVAGGDLDHPIRPAGGAELSRLAVRTGMMVDQLKEQIRRREASEQRFADTVRLLPQAVFETDRSGTVTFANPAALDSVGVGSEELERGLSIFSMISPEERARAERLFDAVLKGEVHHGSEYTGLRRDGSTFAMLVQIAPRTEDGTIVGTRGSFTDISERKRIEEEVRLLNAGLEDRVAQRTADLEAFTYSVSHDLRSPLRAIDGYSSLLEMAAGPLLDETGRRYLDGIHRTIRQMSALIDGLLTLSRLDRQALVREEIDAASLVQEVVSAELEQDPERRTRFTIGALPGCSADRAMLRQVFVNLVGNALKFSRYREDPRVEIGTLPGGGETVYYVRDNGVGFEATDAESVFVPFRRLHRADLFEGSGIGLATVARIIRRHGGRIWATSRPDEGATFFFTLPPAPAA
ncbi:MAG TPA: ATP-binding protein [Methanoregulaceae archaeon]|nr:ATP-binding protein [Methanoregulaceae archaeon]